MGVAIFGSKSGSEHERLQDESSNEGNEVELAGLSRREFDDLHVNLEHADSEEAKELHETENYDDIRILSNRASIPLTDASIPERSVNRYLNDFVVENTEANQFRRGQEGTWPRNTSTSSMTGLLESNASRSEEH